MDKNEMIEKLQQAQDLLSAVYHAACNQGLQEVERAMSVADSCILDAIENVA